MGMAIRPYQKADQADVLALWSRCCLIVPHNDPVKDIERKLAVGRELFLVGIDQGKLVSVAMGGYEGHRGWVNYLAVSPACRGRGFGRQMMEALEQRLLEMGCPKLNLQIRSGNEEVIRFYRALGYREDPVISMGKRLIPDR
jgi:ribosomal protein S18 acetylase RimI-like enzyme